MASSNLQRVFYVWHHRHGAVPCEVRVCEFKFGFHSHILKSFVRLEDSAWRAAEAAWALIWKTAKLAASSRGKLDIWIFDIWCLIFDIWYLEDSQASCKQQGQALYLDIWYLMFDIWYWIFDIWKTAKLAASSRGKHWWQLKIWSQLFW